MDLILLLIRSKLLLSLQTVLLLALVACLPEFLFLFTNLCLPSFLHYVRHTLQRGGCAPHVLKNGTCSGILDDT